MIPLPVKVESIPTELKVRERWVAWRLRPRGNKLSKIPVNPHTGGTASSTDPATWSTFAAAVAFYEKREGIAGIGFVFANGDSFVGVDLDDCVDPETGGIESQAGDIVSFLNSYAEISPSGAGIKIFLRGALPEGRRRAGKVEMYCAGRYFTVTGHALAGSSPTVELRTRQLAALHARILGKPTATTDDRAPDSTAVLTPEDIKLLDRARRARNGEKFATLWRGDLSGYASPSEADLALVSMLAFWTDSDAARIDRIFRNSALCRAKWSERADYRERTIAKAFERRTSQQGKLESTTSRFSRRKSARKRIAFDVEF
jgi:primase-polymerase (primpol)-like protein